LLDGDDLANSFGSFLNACARCAEQSRRAQTPPAARPSRQNRLPPVIVEVTRFSITAVNKTERYEHAQEKAQIEAYNSAVHRIANGTGLIYYVFQRFRRESNLESAFFGMIDVSSLQKLNFSSIGFPQNSDLGEKALHNIYYAIKSNTMHILPTDEFMPKSTGRVQRPFSAVCFIRQYPFVNRYKLIEFFRNDDELDVFNPEKFVIIKSDGGNIPVQLKIILWEAAWREFVGLPPLVYLGTRTPNNGRRRVVPTPIVRVHDNDDDDDD
jgi:hypothetical protein